MNINADVQSVLKDTLVLILAGGQGSRLKNLTETRSKPALEFGGQCRIIDFPLSNCVNSGLNHIGVLTQYKSQCLIHHLMKHWGPLNSSYGGRLDILPASQQYSENWYLGTADACYQNLQYIESAAPKYVMVLSGDHVYKMDYRDLITTHLKNNADMTISCIEVSREKAANQFGVIATLKNDEVIAFEEKPTRPSPLTDKPDSCLASMGNYIVNSEVFLALLKEDALRQESAHDFGKNVIPQIIKTHRIFAHRFGNENEGNYAYWRDVGTLDSYWEAHMDLLDRSHWQSLFSSDWPIWAHSLPDKPVGVCNGVQHVPCTLQQVLVGSGCQLTGCTVKDSVLSSNCIIESDAVVQNCVLMPEVIIQEGCRVSDAIVDKGVCIPAETIIDDPLVAKIQGFEVTADGVILVTQKMLESLKSHKTKLVSPKKSTRINPLDPALPINPSGSSDSLHHLI